MVVGLGGSRIAEEQSWIMWTDHHMVRGQERRDDKRVGVGGGLDHVQTKVYILEKKLLPFVGEGDLVHRKNWHRNLTTNLE